MTMLGNLIIISAPSGAGKSSLIQAYLNEENAPPSKVSISHTTRAPRPGEEHGKHYHFVHQTDFLKMVEQKDFIEYATVFENYYGTSKSAIESELKKGINVFLDIDWQGARQVREKMPGTISIFILPPSLEVLHQRLIKRGQDSESVIEKRMQQAKSEISHYDEYDYVLINDDFNESLTQFKSIIIAESLRANKISIEHFK